MICPNCKKNNKPDSLFCEYCGSQLKKQKKSKKGLWITLSVIFVVIAVVIAVCTIRDIREQRQKQEHLITWRQQQAKKKQQELEQELRAERKAREEAARKAEAERKTREEAERKAREEAARKAEAERKAREESGHKNEINKTQPKQEQPNKSIKQERVQRYVDLGLSVKWATCNVGASKPEQYGDYFAWGETKPKKYYSRSNHLYKNKSKPKTLPRANDAAHANWGGTWRMPTWSEQYELREKCTWKWTTQNGVNGYKVTSKSNGNSIFLPAAGSRKEYSLYGVGSYGHYWLHSRNSSHKADAISFGSSGVHFVTVDYYEGLSVRPVCP